jgi:hypothetical protein
LELVFVPHWNNGDGGAWLDTSRCYLGQSRFDQLRDMLPSQSATVVGIDEHTALWVETAAGVCRVLGKGNVTVIREAATRRYASGTEFSIRELGPFRLPGSGDLPAPKVDEFARDPVTGSRATVQPGADALAVARLRQEARRKRQWHRADALREELRALGWQVQDTPEGTLLIPSATDPQED